MKYRSEIDGLRAIAVIPVILFHAGVQWFSGGFVGVDVFFVISGYLITTIIIAELDKQKFSIANFYERRARRILPALFFVIACCLPFAWFLMLPSGLKSFSESLLAVSVFSSNLLFWSESGYFDVSTHYKPLLHTWSLAVEEQYYIFFPLFLMCFWKVGKTKLFWILLASFIICLFIGYWGMSNKPNAAFYLLPFRAWELLIGACAGFYLYKNPDHLQIKPKILHQTLGILGILLILYSVFSYNQDTNTFKLYALPSTIGATLVILYASSNTYAAKILSIKPMVGIGLISYSAYLWHQPIFSFARHASIEEPSVTTFIVLSILVLPLSWFSWKFIETPFRNKNIFNQAKIFKLSIVGTLIVIAIGLSGYISQGFLSRYKPEDRALATLNPNEIGDYVKRRFEGLSMKPFDMNSDKTKVLIIGDSYAEDIINAMYEVGLNEKFQFSTRHIGKQCGNLFISFDEFKRNVKPSDLAYCEKRALTQDKELIQLIKTSDEVWFVSAWYYWQAKLLPESIENLKGFSKKIRVFSSKNMGEINIKNLLAVSQEKRTNIYNKPTEDSVKTNAFLRISIPPQQFVDIEQVLCNGTSLRCPIFTKKGNLITYDGGHLTPDGAKQLGLALKVELLK